MWTLTTALFNTLHDTVAGKGTFTLNIRQNILTWQTISNRCTHIVSVPRAIPFLVSSQVASVYYWCYDICFTPLIVSYTRERAPRCIHHYLLIIIY